MRSAAFRWIAAATAALAAGILLGMAAGRIPVAVGPKPVHAAARSGPTREGRDTPAPVATPTPTPVPTPGAVMTANTVNLSVGGLERTYQVFRPTRPVTQRIPALVVLHGVTATIDLEEQRDGLLPLAAAGQAVLAYPAGYGLSWNAGACCEPAAGAHVDDVNFIAAVVQQLSADPMVDDSRITLVGFSNGGRMAYQVDCTQPGLVTSVVVVLAAPVAPCNAGAPVSFLAIATADDPEVPYASGTGPEFGLTAVTDVVRGWTQRDGCDAAAATRTTQGQLNDQVWPSCRWGTKVELGTYAAGGHLWPAGDSVTPSAERLIWNFAVASTGLSDPLPQ